MNTTQYIPDDDDIPEYPTPNGYRFTSTKPRDPNRCLLSEIDDVVEPAPTELPWWGWAALYSAPLILMGILLYVGK